MLYLHSVVCPFGQSVYWSYSSEVALFISGKGRQVSIGWLISHTRKCEPRLLSHISHKNKFQMDLSPKYERQGFLVFRRKPGKLSLWPQAGKDSFLFLLLFKNFPASLKKSGRRTSPSNNVTKYLLAKTLESLGLQGEPILKEISPEYSLEGLMLKLQCFGHLIQRTDSLERTWCWERLKAGWEWDNRGWDDWMASPNKWAWVWESSGSWWWTGSLGCCSPWGHKELDTTEQLNNSNNNNNKIGAYLLQHCSASSIWT